MINNTNYFAANIEARAGIYIAEKTGRRIPPMSERFMSAADFRAALALLHERGVSANELHRINNQPRRWARIGAPRYVALALAAVLQDIPSWTPPRRRSRPK